MPMLRLAFILLASAAVGAQTPAPQTPQGRDLILVPDKPVVPREGVPRGYALIVGVAQYRNLDASKQLQFSESDAESFEEMVRSIPDLVDETLRYLTVERVEDFLRDAEDRSLSAVKEYLACA